MCGVRNVESFVVRIYIIPVLALMPIAACAGGPQALGVRASLAETYEANARYWEERARHYAYGNAKVSASRYRAAAEEAKARGLTQPLGKGTYPSIADQENVLGAMAEGASRHYQYGTSITDATRRRTRATVATELGLTEPLKRPVGPLFGSSPGSGRYPYGFVRQPPRFRRVAVGTSFGVSGAGTYASGEDAYAEETDTAVALQLADGSIVYVLGAESLAGSGRNETGSESHPRISEGETVWVEPVGEDAEGRVWGRVYRADGSEMGRPVGVEGGDAPGSASETVRGPEIEPGHADPAVLRTALAQSYALALREARAGQAAHAAHRLWSLAWYVETCLGMGIIPIEEGRRWQNEFRTTVERLYAAADRPTSR